MVISCDVGLFNRPHAVRRRLTGQLTSCYGMILKVGKGKLKKLNR